LPEPAGTADAFESIEALEVTEESDARADFDARFALARERLLRITGSLVGSQEADDVVHDTYLLGRQRYGQLRDPSAFGPWLTRIAVNQCFGRHRRTRRLRELLPALPRGDAASDIGLRELVEQLPGLPNPVLRFVGRAGRLHQIDQRNR